MKSFRLIGGPIPSEYEPVEATSIAEEVLGYCGRMISGSKSAYKGGRPVFNANVCTRQHNKVWFGDLDLDLDGEKLEELAERLGVKVYVLREFDARFRNEEKPLFDEAVEVYG